MKTQLESASSEELHALLAAIVDSSDDAIISKNLNGIITSWNRSAERTFGYTADEAIGNHISLIIPEEKLDEEYIILGKIAEGKRVEHFETERRTKDGRLLTLSLTISPIRAKSGKIIGASKVARDITEQKRTEQELIESNLRKDEFMAGVSHELRTPMNAIIGLSNILAISPSLTAQEQEYVGTLKHSAEGLMTLINNLLDFSKLDSGSLELENMDFNLTETVKRSVNLVTMNAEEKGLDIHVSYDTDVHKYYRGDAFRIQQILANLLANAVKFTERGTIQLNIAVQKSDMQQDTVIFSVKDTGIGIPENKLPMIFEKFVQADASITRKYGGTGLGLSICKALAENMGGNINVKSQVDLGSTFNVTLPLTHAENTEYVPATHTAAPAESNYKNILVVDDYEPNLVVVTALLDRAGYDYDMATTGLEALKKFQNNRYDVILMDVQMNDMDGYESTRRIRSHEKDQNCPPTPILAMTAHVFESDRDKCLAAGMNDFIAKPFDPDTLTARLSEFVKKPKTA